MNSTLFLNLLDWPGPQFLGLYMLAFGLVIVAIAIARHRLHEQQVFNPSLPPLTGYQLALLEAGPRRVVDAALTALGARRIIDAHPTTGEIFLQPLASAPPTDPLELAIYERLRAGRVEIGTLRGELAARMDLMKAQLEQAGLLFPKEDKARLAVGVRLAPVLLFLLGAVKLMVGLEHGKPVFYLVILSLLCFGTMLYALNFGTRRTPLGEGHLRRAKDELLPFRRGNSQNRALAAQDPQLLPMLVGVYGLSMIAAYGHERITPVLQHGGSGSSSSGGCGSSGCGGGDGGGCGGGGCGGCGGD